MKRVRVFSPLTHLCRWHPSDSAAYPKSLCYHYIGTYHNLTDCSEKWVQDNPYISIGYLYRSTIALLREDCYKI